MVGKKRISLSDASFFANGLFICIMDQDYRKDIVAYLREECEKHHISLQVVDSPVFSYDIFLPELSCCIVLHAIGSISRDQDITSPGSNEIDQKLKVIHVWEDQWIFQQEKIMSKLKSLLGVTKRIYGRKTQIIQIDNRNLIDFQTKNHLNVPLKAKYKFGLAVDKDLVAVMSFSKGRKIVREGEVYHSYELLRFCNKLNTTVVGGFSKLLYHFINLHNPDDIMTYVDADWSYGEVFVDLGFEFVEKLPPMEFWLNLKTGIREYPHLVLEKENLSIDFYKTEREKIAFLEKHGYRCVYNSGSYKYLLKLK